MSSTASASTACNGREPPLKKKKPSTEPTTIRSLPDDLVVSCIARVSRFNYPFLSLVSKIFRSLIASPELYRTRNLLGCTENCLYVCLQFPPDPNPHWFTLWRKPDQTLTNHTSKNGKGKKKKKEKSSGNFLASIRMLNSPTVEWSNLIAVGSYLYAIRGPIEDAPCSSSVAFLDCRTHTWLEAPRMRLAHTENQTWKPVPPGKRIFKPENMEGKLYIDFDGMYGKKGMVFNLKDMTGGPVGLDTDGISVCKVRNINYCYTPTREFLCFDTSVRVWRKLEGLKGLPKFSKDSNVKLVGYGDQLVVLWDKYVRASRRKEKMIWCAEISLERCNSEEIWGTVEWFDAVLEVPKSYKYVYAIAASI